MFRFLPAAASALLLPALAAAPASLASAAPSDAVSTGATAAVAPGAPGATSYYDLARKDCVGTARDRVSKVWFTVADGVLSDVYEPTVDTTNVKTLQYIVTDGHTFSDLQTRDLRYTVSGDPTGHGHGDQPGARLPDRHNLRHRPVP
jgi:glucoamylase